MCEWKWRRVEEIRQYRDQPKIRSVHSVGNLKSCDETYACMYVWPYYVRPHVGNAMTRHIGRPPGRCYNPKYAHSAEASPSLLDPVQVLRVVSDASHNGLSHIEYADTPDTPGAVSAQNYDQSTANIFRVPSVLCCRCKLAIPCDLTLCDKFLHQPHSLPRKTLDG